ncbi:MAG: hypothetical protein LC739_03505 [Actinobacteria bacterium]|nr:hypothetical protein [Actinomycetota bacterium]
MGDRFTNRRGLIAAMAFFLLLAVIPVTGATDRGANCDPDDGGISLPEGFCATVFADGLTRARHIAITKDGAVYFAINNARDGSAVGGVVGLRDLDNDGHADEEIRLGDNGGNGVAIHGRYLYF